MISRNWDDRMERSELISFAMDFVSFLLRDASIAKEVEKIILFGSITRNEFDEKSDVDLFIQVSKKNKKLEDRIRRRLNLFNKSKEMDEWRVFGIKNDISLKMGRLEEWKSLRRSIISDGITLYGKYKELPKKLKQYTLFSLKLGNISRNKKIKIWRKLYGYRQKVGKKIYSSEGLIKRFNGKKLGRGTFIIPIEHAQEVIDTLKKEKINYSMSELWQG